jgi:hypothetical protein
MQKHFTIYENEFHKVSKHIRNSGDPPHSGDLATKVVIMLRILEQGKLQREARNSYYSLGHGFAGAMQRKLAITYWHPELILAVQQAVAKCP